MEVARRSIVVRGEVEETHRRWLEFTGQTPLGKSTSGGNETASAGLGAPAPGTVYFTDEAPGATRVTLELRFNPRAVEDAGRADDWVERRIDLYLQRFEHQFG